MTSKPLSDQLRDLSDTTADAHPLLRGQEEWMTYSAEITEEANQYPNLGAEYFAAREAAERFLKHWQEEHAEQLAEAIMKPVLRNRIRNVDEGMKTMSEKATCKLCGHPMPEGEEMFKFHGYSGPCPSPPLIAKPQSALDRIMADPELRRARQKLSMHELRLIIRHAKAATTGES